MSKPSSSPGPRGSRAGASRERFDLGTLNPPQREAVLHEGGPLLVLAGAGSGKTRVIVYRVARLLRDGIPPAQILGMTFTNKAANEMRERLAALAGPAGAEVHLSTFHSLGLRLLREEREAAGLGAGFCIYDSSDQLSLVRELMRQIKVADRRLDAARVLEIILRTKRERRKEVEIDYGDDYELAALDLYPRYLAQMRAFNAVDFDDLILRAQDLLDMPEVRERWSTRFRELLVDEYQDTSPDQLQLLKVLAGRERNLCVVGDDDQAIYGWRGAAVDNILSFGRQFGGAKEIILDQNYRSTGNILAAANSVICNNSARKPKKLWSAGGAGEPVEIIGCADGDDEAAFVAESIGRLLYEGVHPEEIAVLYRSNIQSRIFEETLTAERIRFRVVGGQAFFERKEVRDALAYLAVAANPHDEVALRRIINVPPRGIGPASVERLAKHGEQTGRGLWGALLAASEVGDLPAAALVGANDLMRILAPAARELKAARSGELAPVAKRLFDELHLRDSILAADDAPTIAARRLENLDEVVDSMSRFEVSAGGSEPLLFDYLRQAALASRPEEEEEAGGLVTLMTLHGAKGLEFPYVFLVGVEEELLPHRRTLELGGELSEERRLCYVGMTRARKRLWLTWARRRLRYGSVVDRTPSRFLQEIADGPGVRRRNRDEQHNDEQADTLAAEFFAKMRSQLGIED